MRTSIHPNSTLKVGDKEFSGFWVGTEFILMLPHKGHVGMAYTSSMRPMFKRDGNSRDLIYRSCQYQLEIRAESVPVAENEIERLVASCGQRLVVIDAKNKEADECSRLG